MAFSTPAENLIESLRKSLCDAMDRIHELEAENTRLARALVATQASPPHCVIPIGLSRRNEVWGSEWPLSPTTQAAPARAQLAAAFGPPPCAPASFKPAPFMGQASRATAPPVASPFASPLHWDVL